MYLIGAESTNIPNALAQRELKPRSKLTFIGRSAFYGMLAAIMFVAVSYGTIDIWRRSLFIVLISVVGMLRVLDGIRCGAFTIARPILLLPLTGILLLAAAQIPRFSAFSVDPYNTELFILTFGGLVVTFEVLSHYSNSAWRVRALAGLVIIVGVGSAMFGILRGSFPEFPPGILAGIMAPEQGFGQFQNRNHFAVLLEMSFGLLLGILIKGELPRRAKLAGWIMSAIMFAGIIASSSRGGLISLAALSSFAVFVHVLTRNRHISESSPLRGSSHIITKLTIGKVAAAVGSSFLIVVLIWAAIGFVGGDYLVSRVEKIRNEVAVQDGTRVNRNIIWRSTVDSIKDRPILGSGFGAYAEAIPRFDRTNGKFALEQAHNDYLELSANGGIVGFALFFVFFVLVAIRIVKNLRSADHVVQPLCFGASIGIFGVLIHSFVDFGLHIMLNALVFTVLVVISCSDLRMIRAKDVGAPEVTPDPV